MQQTSYAPRRRRFFMHWLYHTVRHFLLSWGYWAVIAGLLGENAGLPVPGETTLMFASFLANKTPHLKIYWVIVVGIAASITGDNIGFFLGRKFGSTLIRWVRKITHSDEQDVAAAKDLIRHHGGRTVFFARFIFGLRTIAGPLAGSLEMEWRRFVIFNALGAVAWVTSISLTGFAFANAFATLLDYFDKAAWALSVALFVMGYVIWRRYKSEYKKRSAQSKKAA
jgi:membrane-associated protein